jgi:hypothetical protein
MWTFIEHVTIGVLLAIRCLEPDVIKWAALEEFKP